MVPASRIPDPVRWVFDELRDLLAQLLRRDRHTRSITFSMWEIESGSPVQRSEVRLTKQTNRMCSLVSQ
jgi:hypothetical protein